MNRLAILMMMVFMLFCGHSNGQISAGQGIWECTLKRKSADEGEILMKGKIVPELQMYEFGNRTKGPIKISFKFQPDNSYQSGENISRLQPLRKFEQLLGIPVIYSENEAEFDQKIKLKGKDGTIRGAIQFMQCSEQIYVVPQDFGVSLKIFK
ncbi:hypothetical protein [Chryseobacterium geocarposphaerae]|uniref:GLPGLI family protein n=1 Tax=Chryseobacterium geocarposphaerae TaxID=1416776 RepID=A0A2M9C6G5_9FLAO|nr:hypothetical protein [Chryseobacterium geocarposphaerae]PJJ66425.1 hypothetical protein CLV73_0408 [Chryseobacterium geocarposphaerae]